MYSLRTLASPISRAAVVPRTAGASITGRTFTTSRVFLTPALTDAITGDHKEIKRCYEEVMSSNDVEHQERYGNKFIWELARHSVAEELIVYPAMERYMPPGQGQQHAEKDRKQHHTVSSRTISDFSGRPLSLGSSRNISRPSRT